MLARPSLYRPFAHSRFRPCLNLVSAICYLSLAIGYRLFHMSSPAPSRKSQILNVIQVSSGNFLEMYDFMVFGYYAGSLGCASSSGSRFASLMLSFVTFGAGF